MVDNIFTMLVFFYVITNMALGTKTGPLMMKYFQQIVPTHEAQ